MNFITGLKWERECTTCNVRLSHKSDFPKMNDVQIKTNPPTLPPDTAIKHDGVIAMSTKWGRRMDCLEAWHPAQRFSELLRVRVARSG